MKTIGIIGGITWYSSMEYYRLLNELTNKKLGGVHSARIILNSVDFAGIKELSVKEDWDAIALIMIDAAKAIEAAGADCLLLGANTMHNIADKVQAAIGIPLVHIVDAVGGAIRKKGLQKVGLLGTRYTMQMDFYKQRLQEQGIEVIVPGNEDMDYVNDSIYNEFSKGIFTQEKKIKYLSIIEGLINNGAEGIIFGCTEIPILLKQADCSVPVFDTAFIHATAAVAFSLTD